jgi:hypothetical protein
MFGSLQRRKQLHDNRPYYYRNVLDCSCPVLDNPIKDGAKCRELPKSATTILDKDYAPTHEELMRTKGLTIDFRSCGGPCDAVYIQSNEKYGAQGAVSAGTRLLRLKYDAVISAGETYTPYIRNDNPIDPYCKPIYVNGRKIK